MRRKFWVGVGVVAGITVAAWLLKPSSSLAFNGITAITVVKGRNLTSVAIEAIVQGDDDSSAVLRIFQRTNGSSAAYDTGMVMVRRQHGPILGIAGPTSAAASGEIFEGRIMWLTPGVTAQFYIEGIDAGGNLTTAVDTVSCIRVRPPVASGSVFYVDGINGLDTHGGTSVADAEKTIAAAVADLKSSPDSGGFGGIRVLPGEYHETVLLDCCTDGRPRFIEGLGDRDTIIVCGASQNVENGNYDDGIGHTISWTKIEPGGGEIDSVYWTPFTQGDSCQLVVLGFGEMLHRKTSLRGLFADSTYGYTGSVLNFGEASGWWWSGDSLYVKRRNGASPAGLKLHTGYRDELVKVRAPNWRVANLSIRYAGSLDAQNNTYRAKTSPGMNGYGIILGKIISAGNFAVDSLKIYGCNAASVYNPVFGNGARADSGTVTNCYIDGLTVGTWNYDAAKSHPEEEANQFVLRCRNTSVRNNFLTGTFNGLGFGNGITDSVANKFSEVSGNTLKGMTDDGIELDLSHQINIAVVDNTLRDTGSGFSLAAAFTGPIFAFYNTVYQFRAKGVKLGNGHTAIAKFYQNTFASTSYGDNLNSFLGCQVIDATAGGGGTDNLEFRNNIFVARGGPTLGVYSVDAQFSTTTNNFNYDLIDTLLTIRPLRVVNTTYSFPQIQTTFGWETNGIRAKAWFADSANFDYRFSKTSPAWKAGRRITGVNTGLTGNRYPTLPSMGSQPCACPDQ